MEARLHFVYSAYGPFTTQVMSHQVTGSSNHTGQDCWAWFTDAAPTPEFEQHFCERRLCLDLRVIPSHYQELLSDQNLDVKRGRFEQQAERIMEISVDGGGPLKR